MSQIDYSIGFTQAEVEEILTAQKAELKKNPTCGPAIAEGVPKAHRA